MGHIHFNTAVDNVGEDVCEDVLTISEWCTLNELIRKLNDAALEVTHTIRVIPDEDKRELNNIVNIKAWKFKTQDLL